MTVLRFLHHPSTPDPLSVLALLENEQKYQNAHKIAENMSRIKRWKSLGKVARSADPHPGSADPWPGRPTFQVGHLPPH
ncbi:hypothetical protein U9M48_008252 [Paspalum notatum var. saurae]|uniref:Uncharacterized protein n=1 Tax=Paspalum notatum var. saurae TaxID=547442 RepID=A0AAQ3WD54_PASNO